MLGITTSIILDKRIKRKDDSYAIKLRVTFNREQKYFPLGKHFIPERWTKLNNSEERERDKELKRIHLNFADIEKKAIKIIDEMETFSFQEFAVRFNDKPKSEKTDVLATLNEKQQKLQSDGRLSSAESYRSTIQSFKDYLNTISRKRLKFAEITTEWLENYEKWMKIEGRSISTIGIYLRNLRTVFNQVVDNGSVNRDLYPFSKYKYQIPSGRNTKKALYIMEIKKVLEYVPVTQAEERARDLWVFSYLCNGVNIKDIAKLKYKDINFKHINFIRSKTERSAKANQKNIVVLIMPEIKALIEKWGTKPTEPQNYIFDILDLSDNEERRHAKIKQAVKTINKYTKRIGETLGFALPLTTYTARHSFATVLKRSGTPTDFIKESLGHADKKTTENYLDSFEDETRKEFQKKLLNF